MKDGAMSTELVVFRPPTTPSERLFDPISATKYGVGTGSERPLIEEFGLSVEDEILRYRAEAYTLIRKLCELFEDEDLFADTDWWDIEWTAARHVVIYASGLAFFLDHETGKPLVARFSADRASFAVATVRRGHWWAWYAPPMGEEQWN